MSGQPLAHRAPQPPRQWKPNRRGWISAAVAAGVIIGVNAALVLAITLDRNRFGPFIASVVSPIVNCLLAIFFFACTPIAKNFAKGASMNPYLAVSTLMPACLYFVDMYLANLMH